MKESLIETLKSNLEDMAYSNTSINLGIDRQVSAKVWEKAEIRGPIQQSTAIRQADVLKDPTNADMSI